MYKFYPLSLCFIFGIIAPLYAETIDDRERIVVLLDNGAELSSDLTKKLIDKANGALVKKLKKHFQIITREHVYALVGYNIACDGLQGCAVERGREVGAHYVIQLRISKSDAKILDLSLGVYQTKTSEMLDMETYSTRRVSGLSALVVEATNQAISNLQSKSLSFQQELPPREAVKGFSEEARQDAQQLSDRENRLFKQAQPRPQKKQNITHQQQEKNTHQGQENNRTDRIASEAYFEADFSVRKTSPSQVSKTSDTLSQKTDQTDNTSSESKGIETGKKTESYSEESYLENYRVLLACLTLLCMIFWDTFSDFSVKELETALSKKRQEFEADLSRKKQELEANLSKKRQELETSQASQIQEKDHIILCNADKKQKIETDSKILLEYQKKLECLYWLILSLHSPDNKAGNNLTLSDIGVIFDNVTSHEDVLRRLEICKRYIELLEHELLLVLNRYKIDDCPYLEEIGVNSSNDKGASAMIIPFLPKLISELMELHPNERSNLTRALNLCHTLQVLGNLPPFIDGIAK